MIVGNFTSLSNSSFNNTNKHESELLLALPAAITSLILGTVALLSNGVLLLSLFRDPLKYFKARRATVFILCLACADFFGGSIVQLSYSANMFCRIADVEIPLLYNIGYIGSHLGSKISVLTVVAMSVDRFIAVKLALKYRRVVTVKRIVVCNGCIWLFTICFEASHSLVKAEQEFQSADLHIQTTFPLTVLSVVYLATYLEFRRYSRNSVLAVASGRGNPKISGRNLAIEKKLISAVVLVMVVLFASLAPYLITTNYAAHCYSHNHYTDENDKQTCHEKNVFTTAKNLAISLLCLSSACNPFLYAFRIPEYKRAFVISLKQLGGARVTPDNGPDNSLTPSPQKMQNMSPLSSRKKVLQGNC